MRHIELFSGIGGFRKAMDYISNDLGCNITTVGFSEIDKKAIDTYRANFDTTSEIALGDIVALSSNSTLLRSLGKIDILSGGFPCQTFSMMGGKKGFEEERGQMFFRILDVIKGLTCKPKYLLLENVKNLITHDKGNTIKVIVEELDKAGYFVKFDIFNSKNFGLPQNRNRVILFARLKDCGDFQFSNQLVSEAFASLNRSQSSLHIFNDVLDILEKSVDDKYYLSERIKPTILSDGSGNFKSNSEIDQLIARPLTASMHKMHRACQDNYYSEEFILSEGKKKPSAMMSKEDLAKERIRKLTPTEAFLLQGMPRDFANNASNAGVANGAMYKQAGNAVSVNTIYAVLYYLIKAQILTV